jgi:PAS domain S-box-containing protein
MKNRVMTGPIESSRPSVERCPAEQEERFLNESVREMFLQTQQLRSQEWFNFASDAYLLTDIHGIIDEVNYAAATLFDVRKDYLLGKPLGLFLASESRARFYGHLLRLAMRDGTEQWEARLSRPHREPRDVLLTAAVYSEEQSQGVKLRWNLRDVSMVRRAERAWMAEKNLADCLLDSAEILILLVTARGKILRCNPYALTVSGYQTEELVGGDWVQMLLPAEERDAGRRLLHEARMDGSGMSRILGLAPHYGSSHRISWSARNLGDTLLLIGHDVTELQEAQRQALQAERLAAIGQMSAGLAHEGRNALQRVQASLSLLTLRLQDRPEHLELLGRIQKAQDDLQHLFEEVRAYAAVPRLQSKWCDLRLIWREAWDDLSSQTEWQSAELREDLAGIDLFCHADPFHLKQVFRNLLENALSCGANPVRVVVQCRPASLGAEEAICLRLLDNGAGIPAEARRRMFEPFFTTKVRGTGLGLAICKRIVEAHGGRIHVGDSPVVGAEIIIILPRRGT